MATEDKKNNIICHHLSREITILSDGNVTTCCVDNRAENVFGNIFDQSIEDITERHLLFKKRFIFEPKSCVACQKCLKGNTARPYMYIVKDNRELDNFVTSIFIPNQIVLEASSRCNCQCITCIQNQLNNDLSGVRSGKGGSDLDLMYVAEWLKPLKNHLRVIRAYNYGEPFLNKGLEVFTKTMSSEFPGLKIGVSTNGTAFLSLKRSESILQSGIHHITVSLHGGTAATSRKYLGSTFPFEKIVEGIKHFMQLKRKHRLLTPVVELKCVLFEWNDSDEEISAFEQLAVDLQVDGFHFVPTSGPIGSKRFAPGSKAWNDLLKSGKGLPLP